MLCFGPFVYSLTACSSECDPHIRCMLSTWPGRGCMLHILAGFERCWSDNWGSSHSTCSVIELYFIIIMFHNFVYELGRNAHLFLINK